MLEILAHSDLPHQFVLVPIHASQLAHVSKSVLQTISKLESIHIAQSVLHMRVHNQFGQTKNLSAKMEGIAKSAFLSLLGCEGFDRLQVEVII